MGLKWKPLVAAILVAACSPKPEPKAEATPRETIRFVYAPPEVDPTDEAKVSTLKAEMKLDCADAKLVVEEFADYEDGHVVVYFGDKNDQLLRPPMEWTGHFVSLCDQGMFAIINDSSHQHLQPSFIVNANTGATTRIEPGYFGQGGTTDDHKILWVQGSTADDPDDRPNTTLKVYDLEGKLLFEKTYTEEGVEQEVRFDGVTYSIKIESPGWAN